MKRFLLILTAVLLTQHLVHAQIVLSQTSYPASVIGTDTLKVTTPLSAFPDLTAMANGIWDMDVITDSVPFHFAFHVSGTAGHQFADSSFFNFGLYRYQGNTQSNIATSGYFEYSKQIERIGYSLTFLTAALLDSLIIPSQNSVYSTPRTRIAFPATYNSNWSSSYSSDLAFQLSYGLYGYDHTPGIIRTYTTEKDTVVGWGLMRVKDASGSPSAYQHVLQVQTITYHTDSFFLGGAPFPPIILTMFSVTQGRKDTVYEHYYYRIGEVTPLAKVAFRDAAFSQPYKATTHIQRLIPDQIAAVESINSFRIFPNPVTGNSVTIELPSFASWQYTVTDIAGNTVSEGTIDNRLKKAEIELPASLLPGMYLIRINNNKNEVYSSNVTISR